MDQQALLVHTVNHIRCEANFLGYYRYVDWRWYGDQGHYRVSIVDYEVQDSGISDILGSLTAYALDSLGGSNMSIPIAGQMSDAGISFSEWSGFLSGATYINILPYWHYAE
jgi:hypothetical protein